MFNAHMAKKPDHTKLWSSKGKHLALPFPVPPAPVQGDTASAELSHLFHKAGGRNGQGRWSDRLCCGSSGHLGQAYAETGLFLAQKTFFLAHWVGHD